MEGNNNSKRSIKLKGLNLGPTLATSFIAIETIAYCCFTVDAQAALNVCTSGKMRCNQKRLFAVQQNGPFYW